MTDPTAVPPAMSAGEVARAEAVRATLLEMAQEYEDVFSIYGAQPNVAQRPADLRWAADRIAAQLPPDDASERPSSG